jgi:DNA-binding transcriptional MerR regulator
MEEELSLDDLVQRSGVNLRTIRFYIQEGLMPGPDTRGKYAHYSQRHLDALTLIQRFKQFNMPLQQIKQVLHNSTPDEISQLITYQTILAPASTPPAAPLNESNPTRTDGALDYIRGLERVWAKVERETPAPTPNPTRLSSLAKRLTSAPTPSRIEQAQNVDLSPSDTWQRRVIRDGVELMVRSDKQIDEQTFLAICQILNQKSHLEGEK